MLRDITLGQYYQTDSVIHRLDPRVKLLTTICYIISLFIVDNFIGYILAGAFLALVIKLSKVPLKFMVRGMKSIVFLLVIAVIFNLFLTPGEVIFTFWKLKITRRSAAGRVYGNPACVPDNGFIGHDPDYYAQ